jgi:Aldehyde dehydrogenase family
MFSTLLMSRACEPSPPGSRPTPPAPWRLPAPQKTRPSMANHTDYGLVATMRTDDLARSHRMAGQLRAGTAWINTFGVMDVAVPLGGYQMSRLGPEGRFESVELFSEVKSVYVGL